MSLYNYRESQEISKHDYGFYALIMAAMRKADTENAGILSFHYPSIWEELQDRYNAPDGFLPGENKTP